LSSEVEKQYLASLISESHPRNMQTIVLTGEPKSTQHIYSLAFRSRFPQRSITPKGKRLKWEYQLEARAQWRQSRSLATRGVGYALLRHQAQGGLG
jgi:hypothetical protein